MHSPCALSGTLSVSAQAAIDYAVVAVVASPRGGKSWRWERDAGRGRRGIREGQRSGRGGAIGAAFLAFQTVEDVTRSSCLTMLWLVVPL